MNEAIVLGLATIVGLGVLAQVISWHLRLPSIILLLIFGLIAGPFTGFLQPDKLFGTPLLTAVVSLAVGLILFEGGLSLHFREMEGIRAVTQRLILVGALVSWVLTAVASYFLLGLDLRLSVLMGAILVVTGPTVMIPMLHLIRPHPPLGSILKWEGIMIDPIGATLAVIVFEGILVESIQHAASLALFAMLKTIIIGLVFGGLAAWLLVILLEKEWIPEFLSTIFTLSLVCVVFVLSNHFQEESGLLSATLMGVFLGNQKKVTIHSVVDFSETLGLLLVASLFIALAARVQMQNIMQLGLSSVLFLLVMILFVRPASVFLATVGSSLEWKERFFIAAMAPRGIVAAAVASVFALRLQVSGFGAAQTMVPTVFLIIFGTVLFYGLFSPWLARRLGVSKSNPQGVLFVGAQPWIRDLAVLLQNEGFVVHLVDNNPGNIFAAKMQGLSAERRNVLSESALNDMDLGELGRLLALTPNDNVNSLAVLHFQRQFSAKNVYQIACQGTPTGDEKRQRSRTLRGRILFGNNILQGDMVRRFNIGYAFKKTHITEKFTLEDLIAKHGPDTWPLFVIDEKHQLMPIVAGEPLHVKPGQTLIFMAKPAQA